MNKILVKSILSNNPKQYQEGGKVENFVNKFYDVIAKALIKQDLSLDGINNIVKQVGLESGYGTKSSGENNYSGIKGDKSNGKSINGSYWRNFKSIDDWADFHVKVLDKLYHAAEEPDPDKFVNKLHGKSHGTGNRDYSESEDRYRSSLKSMRGIDTQLKDKKMNYDDWYQFVPKEQNDTTKYNLRRAYEVLPFSKLEAWRKDNDSNHLPTGVELPNGDFEYFKSMYHPTILNELMWQNGTPEGIKWRSQYIQDNSNWPYVKLVK